MTTEIEQQTFKRIARVRSAGWLSFTDLCFHCGYTDTKMRELVRRQDFPRPSSPTESEKGRRWSKRVVDEWMEAHLEAVSDV